MLALLLLHGKVNNGASFEDVELSMPAKAEIDLRDSSEQEDYIDEGFLFG